VHSIVLACSENACRQCDRSSRQTSSSKLSPTMTQRQINLAWSFESILQSHSSEMGPAVRSCGSRLRGRVQTPPLGWICAGMISRMRQRRSRRCLGQTSLARLVRSASRLRSRWLLLKRARSVCWHCGEFPSAPGAPDACVFLPC